ncbi:LuxR C-terminal-related transcriptional regulator [Nonomuraea sp. 3-1Str]|uniref:LuxR C-terminal-related transcriptional regulator n=1 Tax=Nonomuraea sp. 3-1Str TaxID=2929801 RepID=UPI0028662C6A|nr:LuxR C-terminal-related transcriptional regulator [Nonomuraea sp. 3-1Str]MDR8411996.1 LuxR C-terminal-related transcriptional regulator [Nonomuraea sp. 3-1Str]
MDRSVAEQLTPHLPAEVGEIIGRKREIGAIRSLLSTTRLLTLTGTAGVGKTRLATHVAAHVQRAFPDGAWLVELASLQDEQLLAVAVAEALGLQEEMPRPSTESMIDHLRDKRMLLVLDNCEHLVQACASLADTLLGAAPGVRLLATSREALGVPGETPFIVPPMPFPGPDDQVTGSDVLRYDALALLAERAKDIAPEVDIASRPVAAARLCRLLDGIPLAIELAAVWLRVLSLDQIIDRLGHRTHFLRRGYRTALPRHQTLGAAVEWSFELCSVQEQIMWERLSVFAGGFDLAAAEEVCSAAPLTREDVLPLLATLTEKSIVTRETYGTRPRYRILETLREYGQDRLAKSEAAPATRRRHAEYYLGLAERNRAGWFGSNQVECFTTVVPEMPNLRAALDHCLGAGLRTEEAIRIFTALEGYWFFFGGPAEARHWIDRLLDCRQMTGQERFSVLTMGTFFALMQGRIDTARVLLEECRLLADDCDHQRPKAITSFLSGRLRLMTGDYEDAVGLLEQALDWYEHDSGEITGEITGDGVLRDAFLPAFYLSLSAIFAGDPRAGSWVARCREIAEAGGSRGEIALAMWAAGVARWSAGDLTQAASLFRSSLRLERSAGYRYSPAWFVETLAWVAAAQRHDVPAALLIGAADAMRRVLEVSLEGFRPYDDAHRATESSLRARLGAKDYRKAVDEGASFDFNTAIGYALQQPPEPRAESAPSVAPAPALSQPVLTPREAEVARLVAEGMRNRDIAAGLGISQRTAEGHVKHILDKLGFTSRAQIAAWYVNR